MIFGRRKDGGENLEKYAAVVEQILGAIGVNPQAARLPTDQGYGWNFRRGSAIIEVYVSQQDGKGYFQVLSPILHLPQTGLIQLYRRLQWSVIQLLHGIQYVFHHQGCRRIP